MEVTKNELLALNENIKTLGYQLHSILTEIDSNSGLIAAWDSEIDQCVIDQGKNLSNQIMRDLYKEKLKDNHSDYRILHGQLLELKQNKIMILYERDSAKSELEINITDIKRETAKLEADTMIRYIDQTNYLESLKQQESFKLD